MTASAEPSAALPFNDPSRRSRLVKVVLWLVGLAVAIVVLNLLGVDVIGWLRDLWDQIKAVPVGYIVAALIFQSGQTVLAGVSYYGILKAAYGDEVSLAPIVTAYAVGVAMNNFLPANIGTLVTLLMFVALIPSCTFAGAIAAYLVQKIFFTIAGTFVYLYLFLSVPGSFTENLGNDKDHPALVIGILVGAVLLILIVGRIFWRQVKKLWNQAKQGGVILSQPKRYFTRAFLPSLLSWLCKLAVIGIFLAAFAIPVTFESIMWVTGSGSLANVVSITPGRGRHHAGDERARARQLLRRAAVGRRRLLDRAAAHHDRVELSLRAHPRRLHLRVDGRQVARPPVLRGRKGEGGRAEGAAGRQEGSQARRGAGEGHGLPAPAARRGRNGLGVHRDVSRAGDLAARATAFPARPGS